jgi:ubiquinone biosynthesis monooxygenase Coq7
MNIDNYQKNKIEEIIRVNHAGEYGAKLIYQGQICALKIKGDTKTLEIVENMKKQELTHLDYFEKQIVSNQVRPTIMQPIWKIGGFALGFLTAIIDKKSAMTCTTAVEEVIDQHYQKQINELEDIKTKNNNSLAKNINQIDDSNSQKLDDLYHNINKFRQEEVEHRDIGFNHNAKDFVFYKPLDIFIKFTTKLAINISKKI